MSNNKEIQLFTNIQMWYHKHIVHFIIFLILTGLPFVSPYFHWIAYAVGVPIATVSGSSEVMTLGLQVCRIVHRIVAGLWILTTIPMLFVMLPKIGKWDITPHRREGQGWIDYIKEGLADTKRVYIDWQYPKFMGKYNLFQILAAWTVIFVCILMVASGIILWFRTEFSPELVAFVRVAHFAGFVVMILFLIIHIYFAVHPVNRAGFKAMFRTGTDSESHASKKHPGLFK